MSSNAMHKAERLVIGTFPVGLKPTARKGQPPSGRKRQEGRGRALALPARRAAALSCRVFYTPGGCFIHPMAVLYTQRLYSLPGLRFT